MARLVRCFARRSIVHHGKMPLIRTARPLRGSGALNDTISPDDFLLDVDNTLLDNDGIQQDLKDHLERAYGCAARDRYWRILEDLFSESATATISEPCNAFAPSIRAKSSSWRCHPI